MVKVKLVWYCIINTVCKEIMDSNCYKLYYQNGTKSVEPMLTGIVMGTQN